MSSEIVQRLIPLSSRDEWHLALDSIPHSFAHTWQHCHAMHLTTGHRTFLYCCEYMEERILCPLAERPWGNHLEVVTPYGISGFTATGCIPGFPSAWRQFADTRGWVIAFVILHPLFDRNSFTEPQFVHTHNSLFFLNLGLEEEALTRGFSESRRRELRKWHDRGVSIITDRDQLTSFVVENHKEFFNRKNATSTYNFKESTWKSLCVADGVYMVGAAVAGSLQSVLLCSYTQYVADFTFIIERKDADSHGAGLLFHAITHFKRSGIPAFNLGGGVHPGDGIAEFKRRFGADQKPLRSLKQVFQPGVYRELCHQAGVDSEDRNGYFPPYQNPSHKKDEC